MHGGTRTRTMATTDGVIRGIVAMLACVAAPASPAIGQADAALGGAAARVSDGTSSNPRTGASGADDPRETRDIEMPVRVLSVGGEWIDGLLSSADADRWAISGANGGADRTLACADIAAFILQRPGAGRAWDQDDATPINLGLLETVGGQRLPGSFRATGTTNFWDHRWIGAIPIAVDDIATLRLAGSRVPERRAEADTILFLNGDTASGFVASLGLDLVLEPATDSEGAAPRRIPLDRIGAIALAQGDAVRTPGVRLWVADGSVVDGKELRFDASAGWGFQLADPMLAAIRPTRTDDNSAANPIAGLLGSAELTPLGALPRPTLAVPDAHFHFGVDSAWSVRPSDRALLGLSRVELAGPVVARYELPDAAPRAQRIVFTADIVLAEPAPADARVEVEVRLGRDASKRLVLDAANRRASVRLEAARLGSAAATTTAGGAPARDELVINITDGGNGIVGDAIVLERACLLTPAR